MMEEEYDSSSEGRVLYPMQESWDVLIVLDACRYDYFKRVYHEYFQGELKRRISPGSWTVDWAEKVFPDYYEDCVYVSANPFIGLSRKLGYNSLRLRFHASEHFYKVLEVWKTSWDNDLQTVRPESVNQIALEAINRYESKRIIIHYLQPHSPYLTLPHVKNQRPVIRLMSWVAWKIAYMALGQNIGSKFGPLIPTAEAAVVEKIGVEGLRKAYEENLRIVLESVATLLNHLNGRIVITADHGELLGEENKYGHLDSFGIPRAQVEIPWLEITLPQKLHDTEHHPTAHEHELPPGDEELIKSRLQSLGYL